jgi:predicted DNA-binding transcriptional regulator AlpA
VCVLSWEGINNPDFPQLSQKKEWLMAHCLSLTNTTREIAMNKTILTKKDVAKRYGISEKSISTACSRNPTSLPKFFKLGVSSNSPVRFRLEDCLAFEEEMLQRQTQLSAQVEAETITNLADLLNR